MQVLAADTVFMQYCDKHKVFGKASDTWRSGLVPAGLVVQHAGQDFFSLGPWFEVVILLSAVVEKIGTTTLWKMKPGAQLQFVPVMDFADWKAYHCEWCCPLSMCLDNKKTAPDVFPLCTFKQLGACKPRPFLVYAAQEAFWSLPRASLVRLAAVEYKMPDPGNEPALVFRLIKRILDCSDADAVSILQSRGQRLYNSFLSEHLELLQSDGADELLAGGNAQPVKDAQQEAEKQSDLAEAMLTFVAAKMKSVKTHKSKFTGSKTEVPEQDFTETYILPLMPDRCRLRQSVSMVGGTLFTSRLYTRAHLGTV